MQRLAEEKPRLPAGFKRRQSPAGAREKIIPFMRQTAGFRRDKEAEYQVPACACIRLECKVSRKFFVRISNSGRVNLRK